MTAPIYDSNFSMQLVKSHSHRPEPVADGDEIVCAECGSPLLVVCPNNHPRALDRIVYRKERECNCGAPLKKHERQCEHCREEAKVRRCGCGNALAPRQHHCEGCKATRALAMTRRSCACGKLIEKGERKCAECKGVKSLTPPRNKYQDIPGICRVPGCMNPRVPQAIRGVGRPPTNCVEHWHPVVKRGKPGE